METFLFAVRIVLPTLILLLIGMGIRALHIVSDSFAKECDRLCMRVLFPVLIFDSVRGDFGDTSGYLKVFAYGYFVVIVSCIVWMLVLPKIEKDRRKMPVIIQSLYRGNYTMYGIPFSQMMGGTAAAAEASAMAAVTLPLLNIVAVMMYAYYSGKDSKVGKALLKVAKSPIIWAVFVGLFFHFTDITLGQPVEKVISQLSGIASPLAFISLGAKLNFKSGMKNKKIVAGVSIYKLLIHPMIFLPIAIGLFHISGMDLIPVFCYTAAPCAVTTSQLAVEYECEDELAGYIVVLTTVLSTFSIFLFLVILRSLGLV